MQFIEQAFTRTPEADLSRDDAIALPARFGKFELLERIGSGGMAEVYRARLPGIAGFEKTVVVKRLHPRFAANQGFVQMFIDEAKLAAQVQHKNVVQVFELGQEGSELYIAMEYVAGVDLKRLLWLSRKGQRRLPVWLAVHVVSEVLEALAYAHDLVDDAGRRRNIVHCDVTPENVFVSHLGDVKLGDFGVASDDTRTHDPFPGQIKGKIPYMSPEQISGLKPDRRSDVFGAGIVLWEALTQKRLFSGANASEIMAQICSAPRRPPSTLNPEVPPALDAVVFSALEIDRERRTPSAQAFQAALHEILGRLRPRGHRPEDVREAVATILETRVPPGDVNPFRETSFESELPPNLPSEPNIIMEDPLPAPTLAGAHELSAALRGSSALEGSSVPPRLPPPRTPQEPFPKVPSYSDVPLPTGLSRLQTNDLIRSYLGHETPSAQKAPLASALASPAQAPDAIVIDDPITWRSSRPRGPQPILHPGPYHFWLRSLVTGIVGPMGLGELMERLTGWDQDELGFLAVSADRQRWIELWRFFSLLGEDFVPPEASLAHCDFAGRLTAHSLTSLLGHFARSRLSGRLILVRREADSIERVELHLDRGDLVNVGHLPSTLELWQALEAGYSDEWALDRLVHAALHHELPLLGFLPEAAAGGIYQGRALRTRRALEEVFGWDSGQFAFDSHARPLVLSRAQTFKRLPRWLYRSRGLMDLRVDVERVIDTPLIRTPRYFAELDEMQLRPLERRRAEAFGEGYTLGESLAISASAKDEKLALVMAYLLLELGLIRPQATHAPQREARN